MTDKEKKEHIGLADDGETTEIKDGVWRDTSDLDAQFFFTLPNGEWFVEIKGHLAHHNPGKYLVLKGGGGSLCLKPVS